MTAIQKAVYISCTQPNEVGDKQTPMKPSAQYTSRIIIKSAFLHTWKYPGMANKLYGHPNTSISPIRMKLYNYRNNDWFNYLSSVLTQKKKSNILVIMQLNN